QQVPAGIPTYPGQPYGAGPYPGQPGVPGYTYVPVPYPQSAPPMSAVPYPLSAPPASAVPMYGYPYAYPYAPAPVRRSRAGWLVGTSVLLVVALVASLVGGYVLNHRPGTDAAWHSTAGAATLD